VLGAKIHSTVREDVDSVIQRTDQILGNVDFHRFLWKPEDSSNFTHPIRPIIEEK
jgi:hypothetical protein